jgi:aminoglycoside phosphotransferase (APT) family kinase protein
MSGEQYWRQLATQVEWEGIALQGYYNRNYRIGSQEGEVVLRMPIQDAPRMDIIKVPEIAAHRHAFDGGIAVPKLLWAGEGLSVYEYVNGLTLAQHIHRHSLNEKLLDDWVKLLVQVWQLDPQPLKPYIETWTAWEDPAGLWRTIANEYRQVWLQHKDFLPLLLSFGIPTDVFERLLSWSDALHDRPWVPAHCDLHADNVLISRDGLVALDWGLTLVTDPALDVGLWLHKTRLSLENEKKALQSLMQHSPLVDQTFLQDVQRWRALELTKALVVDAVRAWKKIRQPGMEHDRQLQVASLLHERLQSSGQWWGHPSWPLAIVHQKLSDYQPAVAPGITVA